MRMWGDDEFYPRENILGLWMWAQWERLVGWLNDRLRGWDE